MVGFELGSSLRKSFSSFSMRSNASRSSSSSTASATAANFVDGELVHFEAKLNQNYALLGVKNELYCMFQLKTGKSERSVERKPINLAIVLDRSGSMDSEQKLEKAKESILFVIDNLSMQDRLSLVVYDDEAHTVFSGETMNKKDALKENVRAIKTAGCTNLGAGFEQGLQALKNTRLKDSTSRIFLFSDGLVNRGEQKKDALFKMVSKAQEQGIGTSSFGVGADYDQELMCGIAEYGCGNFFFIGVSADIEPAISTALRSLLTLIGKNARLQVRGMNGACVLEMYGHSDIVKGAAINDIKENNLKNVLTKIQVVPSSAGEETVDAIHYKLTYDDAETGRPITIEGHVQLEFLLKDPKREPNEEVMAAVAIQQAADMDAQIARDLAANRVREAQELNLKQTSLLEGARKYDKTGRVELLAAKSRKQERNIANEGASERVQKSVGWNMRMKRADSMEMMYDQGYC